MGKTLDGLMAAYVGECQARNRYTFYASIARKEGFEQISELFTFTAENEKEHGEWFYILLQEVAKKEGVDLSTLKIDTDVTAVLGTTAENLEGAIKGEMHEATEMYPAIANDADSEGYPEIAKRVRAIAASEKHHAERYSQLLENVKNGTVFKKSENIKWLCRKCGYVHFGPEAPTKCPSCDHEQAFYQVLSEKY